MVQVFVKEGDVDRALKILKRKLSEDGDQKRLKRRKHFMPQSELRRRKAARPARKERKRAGS
ncbi:MAG: 30S ribosomal protein S21 [Candidatus Hydrogenedentota bacterium]|nr:MAG: 30S ribosomal protein S21 [Candidatus Hydrogenedentota bacterium]